MKIATKMPKKGQFVKVWKYNGKSWCDTYKYTDKGIMVYDSKCPGCWRTAPMVMSDEMTDIHYIKL